MPAAAANASGTARGGARSLGLRLAALVVCAAALGVHRLPRLPDPAWLVPLAILALAALERPAGRLLLVAIAASVWTGFAAERRLDDRLPDALTGSDFAVSGWVDDFPSGTAERKTFSFTVEQAGDPAVPSRLRLGWYDPPALLEPGASLELTVRLWAPRGLANPGGFDYEQWLLVRGYGATGYVRSARAAPDGPWSLARWWLRVRREAAELLAASAPDAASGALLTALTIGERFGFTEAQWDDLRRTGTTHLVAISGSHVSLVALLVFACVRRLWLRLPQAVVHRDLEAAAVAAGLAAVGYAALAGFDVPVQRSVVMVVAALAVAASRRAIGWGDGLAAALLAVVIPDPFAVLSASFWLSFAAVGMLLLVALRRDVRVRPAGAARRVARWTAALVTLQLCMSFGLAPIAAAYFGEVSLVSPLVNLVAIPYFDLVLVPFGLAALAASALHVIGAPALVHAAAGLASWAWAGIHAAAGVEGAAFALPQPAPPVVALALLGVAAALAAPPLPGRRLAWCALLPVCVPFDPRPAIGTAEVTVLDVGHGLAVVVETRAHRLLFDAGARFPSGFDIGREIVVPALARRSVGLDALIVSHSDNDHAGGVPAVLDAFPETAVIKGPDVAAIPGRVCTAGRRWHWDGVHFEMLHPPADFAERGNESSCVLKVTAAGGSLLITGDIEARGERLLASGPRVAADVVVVAHHGSATSSTPRFVRAARAEVAIVSAAHANRWGFPKPEVVERWERSGAAVLTTGEVGALTIELGENGVELTAERERRRRYWQTN
ncbi:MAG TPA: DNA internalization-related competence protein ComEC/Rec2 [Gammaproteobacteria bacterium]